MINDRLKKIRLRANFFTDIFSILIVVVFFEINFRVIIYFKEVLNGLPDDVETQDTYQEEYNYTKIYF